MKQQKENASHFSGGVNSAVLNQNESSGAATVSSVKKSASSFFEKHAFTSSHQQPHHGFAVPQQVSANTGGAPGNVTSNVASKIPQTSGLTSSSYNMHRQNATRTDASLQQTNSQQNASSGPQTTSGSGSGNSREKPAMKQQFSQNMLSKSQHFASIQFNQQAMLSQQSYLAQGNPGGIGHATALVGSAGLGAQPVNSGMASLGAVHAAPSMQQQNFIGSGLISNSGTNANNSLNTSTSQLNKSGNYETPGIDCSQDAKQQQQQYSSHGGISGIASPSKRHVSKTSMSKRKNAATIGPQNITQQQQQKNMMSPGQPLLEASGLPHHQQAKMMTASQSSLAQKRYSANINGVNAQMTANSANSSQHAASASQTAQQQQMNQQQFSNQGTISKSESNNKLRRISNMKQNKEKSNSDRRNQGLILSNNQATSASGSVSQGLQPAPQYTQSSNPNLRFMHQNGQPPSHNISSNNALPSNLKSTSHSGASGGNGGAPANMSNLTSFQQSHSERTSLTDDAHNSALISMQWQMREGGQNNHAQCNTERYTNDQRVRFMQQLQGSSTHGTATVNNSGPATAPASDHQYQSNSNTSSTSKTVHGSNSQPGAHLANSAGGFMGKKKTNKTNEKLFFVTDHKLYEDQGAPIVGDQLNSSGQNAVTVNANLAMHHNLNQGSSKNLMQYDIEMENIQVNAGNASSSSAQTKGSMFMYHSNKTCKKTTANNNLMSSSIIDTAQAPAASSHQRGAAMAPVGAASSKPEQVSSSSTKHASIVCPIYQSKDFRLMTGQSASMMSTKNSGSTGPHQNAFNNTGSKSDQKDVKRGSDSRKESNKGATTGHGTAARRSMSDDMHEDVYMAKSDHQKSRKRAFKTNSVIEHPSNPVTHHNSSVNSSNDAYERVHYQQVKKNNSVFHQNATASQKINTNNHGKPQWAQDDRFASSSQHYSETSASKIHGQGATKQERRDAEPLADKLLYLTNQACQSKVKSKSQLTNSMKSAQGLRKGIKSPGAGSQSTLQEPSAKAMPTSSKVKISQKFNKFEQSNPAYKMPGHPAKQNLFQTKTLKKQGSGPLNEFKELHKSPEVRHGHVKKNGSISYAILPRTVIPSSDLKAHKKMKSPSPSIKLAGPDPIQRMRSPQTVKQQVSYAHPGGNSQKGNQSAMHDSLAGSAQQHHHLKEPHTTKHSASQQQSQQLFEARRLSQQRTSHKTPQLAPNHQQNKSHLIDSSGTKSAVHHHPASMSGSLAQSKRISFSDMQQNSNKVLSNEGGADEAKKLYCMVDSRKNSQSSLHNVPSLGQTLGQVQILQVDAQGNNKTGGSALNKVQLKTKDKLQNYNKPPGFLSQSPKAKKHSASSKQNSAVQAQSSMLMTHGSANNLNNVSHSKLASTSSHQQKFVHQMQAAYSTANSSLQREMMKTSQSGAIGNGSMSMAQKALLQIQAPKVVHLQSPPSRILVKASPRVSPNPKIRKQGIQTCKVSIDALQKAGGVAGQQKVNRANSKEFLKTIKLMKRGSNSPSPSSNQMMGQGSPTSSQQLGHHHANPHDSTAQLKNYSSQQHATSSNNHHANNKGERQSSQNSNSTLIRPTSQNNKLFSRLQLRRAKEAQLGSVNNHEMVSFSERQTHDVKAQSTASLLMAAPLSTQSNPAALAQQLVDQYSNSQPEGHLHSQSQQDSHLHGPSSSKQPSSAQQKNVSQHVRSSKDQAPNKSANHGKEKMRSKERAVNLSKLDVYDEKGQVTIEKQSIGIKVNAPEKNDLAPRKQRSSKNNSSTNVQQAAQTPGKKVNSQQVAPVSAAYEREENPVTRQAVNKFQTPKTESAIAAGSQSIEQAQVQTNSKNFGLTSQSNEELREQAAFQKDIEKLKRMIRLHFQNYNSAPSTSCEFYRIGRVLGKGAFGKVSLAMHKIAEQLVAIKSMSKETLQCEVDQRRRTKLEMGILKQCNHPNVVRLFDTFETSKHICFVIELCSGGDLFSYIKKRRRLKEEVARFFFKQLVEGLAYIHNAKKVVHRDIKLENILLDATGNVKICDFGVSRQLKTGRESMKEQCGTPAYIAPEILLDEGYVGFKVDMWSAGVCLYAMLIGSVPFKASTMSKLQDLIIKGEYDFKFQTNANSKQLNNPKAATTLLSEEVQDLISKLLQTKPDKRLSAVETLNHPWLQQGDPNLDVYTEKEKQLIQREYMRLNLKLGQHQSHRIMSGAKSSASKPGLMTPTSQMNLESEQILFTEHNLETRMGEEEPNLQNQEEKSFILAPFNSVKSMFIDQGNQIKEVKKDDPPFIWPKEVTDLIAPRRVIKFSTKCREKNRIYEQNNNADLDNGVYNEFVNEQEREEGALMNGQQEECKDDQDPSSSFQQHGDDSLSDEEAASPANRQMVSQNSMFGQQEDGMSQSSDSLEKSFKETEQLASDDEEASMQIAESKKDKVPNQEAMNLLSNSMENDEAELDDDDSSEESPAREQVVTPNRQSPNLGQNAALVKKQQQLVAQTKSNQPNKGAATASGGSSLTKQKSRAQLRQQQVQIPAKASIVVHEYVEPEFVIDDEVVQRIQSGNVIPRWYLIQELTLLANDQDRLAAARDKSQRLNYVTATYFLLVKRKELLELQRRQEAANNNNRDDQQTPPRKGEQKKSN